MEGNEYLPILISLLDSPTGEIGKINDSLFWTGTIPSSKVDEKLVSDAEQRKKLKELIEGLEEHLKSLREENNKDLKVMAIWIKKKELIIEMLQSGQIDLDVYVRYLIEHYRKIESEEEKEFKLILPENIKKMLAIINMYTERKEGSDSSEFLNVAHTPGDASLDDEPIGLVPEIPPLGLKLQERLVLRDGTGKNEENRKKLEDFLELVDKYVEDDGKDKENEDTKNGLDVFTEFCRFIDIKEFGLFGNNVSLIMLRHFRMIFLLEYGYTFEKLSGLDGPTIIRHFDDNLNDETLKIYYTAIAKTLMKYIDYISIGKFILIVMQKYIWQYNKAIQSSEMDVNTFLRTTLDMQSFLKSLINSDIIGDLDFVQIPKLSESQNKEAIHVSKKSLRTYLGRNRINVPEPSKGDVNAELYLTPEVYAQMIYLLFTRKANLKNFGNGFVGRLKEDRVGFIGEVKEDPTDESEMSILSLVDFSNLQVLYNTGKIDDSFLNRLVDRVSRGIYKKAEEKTKNDPESNFYQFEFPSVGTLVAFLLRNKMIDYTKVYKYFLSGYLNISDLEEIETQIDSRDNDAEENREESRIASGEDFASQIKKEIKEADLCSAYQTFIQRKLIYEDAFAKKEPNCGMFKEISEEARTRKNQILLLYKKYKLSTLDKDEKDAVLNDMLEQVCLDVLDSVEDKEYANNVIMEMLREMYRDVLIGFDNINSVDPNYLQELIIDRMFVQGELSLDDIRRIRDSLSDETLVDILNRALADESIAFSPKVNLIRNIFYRDIYDDQIAKLFLAEIDGTTYSGVKYTDILDILREKEKDNSDIDGDTSVEKNDGKEVSSQQNKGKVGKTSKSSNAKIYPQYIRRLLFLALDKDMMVTEYKNGYTVAISPKFKKVIVEKSAKLKRGQLNYNQEPYGYSTRILTEEKFLENRDKLIENFGDGEAILNEDFLLKIVPPEDRVAHNTQSKSRNWLRSMAKYFGIDLETELELVSDSRYTKEELAEIRRVITEYEDKWIDYNER